jgi:hypothetical protein
MANCKFLLNDGVSYILLNDGASMLLMNDDTCGASTFVDSPRIVYGRADARTVYSPEHGRIVYGLEKNNSG